MSYPLEKMMPRFKDICSSPETIEDFSDFMFKRGWKLAIDEDGNFNAFRDGIPIRASERREEIRVFLNIQSEYSADIVEQVASSMYDAIGVKTIDDLKDVTPFMVENYCNLIMTNTDIYPIPIPRVPNEMEIEAIIESMKEWVKTRRR